MLFFSLLYCLSQGLNAGVQFQEGSPGGDRERGRAGREQGGWIVSQCVKGEVTF